MFTGSHDVFSFLSLFSILISIAFAVPNLGVQRDAKKKFPNSDYTSYSTVVKFSDSTIPGDNTKMSDAQFINLAKVAYDEMVRLWSLSNLPSNKCPGAMIALESEGTMYFASSVHAGTDVDFNIADANIENSVGWFQRLCATEGMGTHRTGGRCAEPNVLRLYGDQNGLLVTPDIPGGTYKAPPPTTKSPRVAVWGRRSIDSPNQNKETYFRPCQDNAQGYGCIRMAARYRFKPVFKQKPDPNGEDAWEFTLPNNKRGVCQNPPPPMAVADWNTTAAFNGPMRNSFRKRGSS